MVAYTIMGIYVLIYREKENKSMFYKNIRFYYMEMEGEFTFMKERVFDSKSIVLENGLQLVTVKKQTELMAINIGVKVGALYEDEREKGISHFIEHMMFKGTKSRNNEELNNSLEALGGDYNAYTDYMCTVYSIVALKEEINRSIMILSDMIMNSNFPQEELEKERGVILAELKSSKDDVEDLSFRKINEIAFKNSGLRFDVLGKEDNIRKFTKKELNSYYNKYYIPNNCVLSIVSSLEHEEIETIVRKYFSSWDKKMLIEPQIISEGNKHIEAESYKIDIEQSTLLYLYTFHGLSEEEELALRVLNHRLGESSNSILFREVREKKGLAYDIYTNMDCSKYTKTLYIYTSTDEDNLDEAKQSIEQCVNSIKNRKIIFDEGTLELMKKIFKTSLISTLEDSSELSHYVLGQTIEERDIYEFIHEMECLKKMKSEDIYNVANKVLNNPTIHILKSEN